VCDGATANSNSEGDRRDWQKNPPCELETAIGQTFGSRGEARIGSCDCQSSAVENQERIKTVGAENVEAAKLAGACAIKKRFAIPRDNAQHAASRRKEQGTRGASEARGSA
jgi:hypothetical protein